jgi:hypothetical protein
MASTATATAGLADARTLPSSNELAEALEIEVFDRVGDKVALGDLTKGKRAVLIFTRHFCMSTLTFNSHT